MIRKYTLKWNHYFETRFMTFSDMCQGGQSDRASALAKRWHFYQICVFRFLFIAHLTYHRLFYLILYRDYEGWQIFSSLSWAGFDWSFPLASLLLNGFFSRPREGYCPAIRSTGLTAWLSQWDISGYFCVLYNRTEIWVWKKASAVKKGGNWQQGNPLFLIEPEPTLTAFHFNGDDWLTAFQFKISTQILNC